MAICDFFGEIGFFAVQLKLIAKASSLAFGLETFGSNIVLITPAITLIFYSAYGELTAVAKTDVIQFFFFFFIIVFLAFYIFGTENNTTAIAKLFDGTNPKMQFNKIFTGWDATIAVLALWFKGIFPPIETQFYQRITVCKDKNRSMKVWGLATVIYATIYFLVTFIGIQLLAYTNGFNMFTNKPMLQKEILPFMANKYFFVGLKGLIFVCMVSLAMSTADSSLNGLSLIAANDILPILNAKRFQRTPKSTIIAAFIIGVIAVLLAISNDDIFDLFMFTSCFSMPVISMYLIMTILGLRTHKMLYGLE